VLTPQRHTDKIAVSTPQQHTDKIAVCRLQWLVAGPNLFRIAIAVLGSSCSKSRQVMAAVEATVGQPDDDGGPEVITEVAPPSVEDDPGSAFMNRLRSAADMTEDQLKQRAIELGSGRAVAWPKTHSAMFELVLKLEASRALRDFPIEEADAVRARELRASKAALETLVKNAKDSRIWSA